MAILNLKASDKAVQEYLEFLKEQHKHWYKTHSSGYPPEKQIVPAINRLLSYCAKKMNWHFTTEEPLPNGNIPDGTFEDKATGIRAFGYMEAKDDNDVLADEVLNKINDKDYPDFNILFWQPKKVILIQKKHGVRIEENIHNNPAKLVSVLKAFFEFEFANIKKWTEAISEFEKQIPHLSKGLMKKIERSEKENTEFVFEFEEFYNLCKTTINPNISKIAIKEMIVQHLLTERLLRSIFDLDDFTKTNLIAAQLEKVIKKMTSAYFNRKDFLGTLDYFYLQIIEYAKDLKDFHLKQKFLNDVFERFFQGWAVKAADKLGIVYTPQQVVDFMVNSVDEILKTEFGRKHGLGHDGVHIIDPFVGTGNFIVNVISKIKATKLEQKYESELHCNEIQLMPYYIACVNIEHAYFDIMKKRKPFEGICFADTFQMSEDEKETALTKEINEKDPQLEIRKSISKENSERVKNQQNQDIFVVICNPPYNTNQANEMDNNKNRSYKHLEKEIKSTYSKDSKATLKNKLMDPYVKAIKWASKRIGDEGVVAMITNNGFIEQYAFDGMRKHLGQDFDKIYIFDLGGNVRKNPKLSGTTHNVFGIQVGVSINIFIKNKNQPPNPPSKGGLKDDEKNPLLKGVASDKIGCGGLTTSADKEEQVNIYYARVDEFWKKGQKYDFLDNTEKLQNIDWDTIEPNKNHLWLTEGMADDFENHLLMGDKLQKDKDDCNTIFNLFSLGVATNRDQWAYNFSKDKLSKNMKLLINTYNSEIERWGKSDGKTSIDDFVTYDDKLIKWSSTLKKHLLGSKSTNFDSKKIRFSTYRPFTKQYLYYDRVALDRPSHFDEYFPTPESEKENRVICHSGVGSNKPFHSWIVNLIPCLDMLEKTQCFPFYIYNEDGTGRKENITDHALKQFQIHYKNQQPPNPPSKGGLNASEEDPLLKGVRFSAGKSGGLRVSVEKEITKWDIFYYIYAMLHHPDYRDDFKENLKRSLPRIPFAPDFFGFSEIGKKLANIHLNYESAEIYDLDETVDNKEFPNIGFRVEKMKLKKDEGILVYNNAITFTGIPKEVHDYKLGNRSALEWIVDQYRVKTDKRSGITQDPNNFDGNEKYIFELIGKIVTVSLETVKLVSKLSKLPYK